MAFPGNCCRSICIMCYYFDIREKAKQNRTRRKWHRSKPRSVSKPNFCGNHRYFLKFVYQNVQKSIKMYHFSIFRKNTPDHNKDSNLRHRQWILPQISNNLAIEKTINKSIISTFILIYLCLETIPDWFFCKPIAYTVQRSYYPLKIFLSSKP